MSNILEEYLVKIGFDVQTGEASRAVSSIKQLTGSLEGLGNALKFGGLVALFAKLTDSIVENIKAVAKADLEYEKLGREMWISKESAKALSVVLKTMGVSEKDAAWVPELREQFARLRGEMNELATPQDAEGQLKWIREIGYDVQSLQLKFQMLKEWVVYYLIKYMEPMIKQFREFIQWVNTQLGQNMPSIAKKIANGAASFVKLISAGFRVVKNGVTWLWGVFKGLPARLRALIPAFAAAGALIMASPFGMMLTAIGGALLLLEDFFAYTDGRKSSKMLAPVWESITKFINGAGSEFMEGLKKNIQDTWKGLDRILDALTKIFKKINIEGPKAKDFFRTMNMYVDTSLKILNRLGQSMGVVLTAMAQVIEGDIKGAGKTIGYFMKDLVVGTYSDLKSFVAESKKSTGGAEVPVVGANGDRAEQAAAAAKYVESKTGIPADLIYAQWSHESGNFSSPLARENLNFGGLTQPGWNGDSNKQPDGPNYYKVYKSVQEYADDYIKSFIALYKFDPAKIRTPEDFAKLLKDNDYYSADEGEYARAIRSHSGKLDAAYKRYKAKNSNQTYADAYANHPVYGNDAVGKYTSLSGALTTGSYSYKGGTIGPVTINITTPSGQVAKEVKSQLESMWPRVGVANAEGGLK